MLLKRPKSSEVASSLINRIKTNGMNIYRALVFIGFFLFPLFYFFCLKYNLINYVIEFKNNDDIAR